MKNIKEILQSRTAKVSLISALGIGALTACGPDYESHGNEFKAVGRVSSVGDHSISLNGLHEVFAHGKSIKYLKENPHDRIHDNYNKCEFLDSRKKIGVVIASDGKQETLQDIKPGEEVVVIGSVHDTAESCSKLKTYSERAIFETVQELPQ